MKNHIIAALLASTCAFGLTPAHANTVYFSHVFDLSQPTYQEPDLLSMDGPKLASQQVQVGDVVDMTYTFLPEQSIRMSGASGGQILWAGVETDSSSNKPNTSNFTISNIAFDLLGAGGAYQAPQAGAIHSSGSSHIGSYFAGDYITEGQSVTFKGIHARFTVLELQDNAHNYNAPFFLLASFGGSVSVQAVPEVETWAMLLASLGVLAGIKRRRASAAARA